MTQKTVEQFVVNKIRFLGEQDGPTEQLLKARLSNFFLRYNSIKAAYLARVDFGESTLSSVALCIMGRALPQTEIAQHIQQIFAAIFNESQHMEVLFLNERLDQDVERACRPFFRGT